jgi:hypothetical protein
MPVRQVFVQWSLLLVVLLFLNLVLMEAVKVLLVLMVEQLYVMFLQKMLVVPQKMPFLLVVLVLAWSILVLPFFVAGLLLQ